MIIALVVVLFLDKMQCDLHIADKQQWLSRDGPTVNNTCAHVLEKCLVNNSFNIVITLIYIVADMRLQPEH